MSDTQPDTRPGERRGPRWTIGQFSRMTRLTARMLRHYDRLGLLAPARSIRAAATGTTPGTNSSRP